MYISKKKKEEVKAMAITELFNSGQLQTKIESICHRHHIPTNCDIQSDITQETFYHLQKYDTQKFYEAYKANPARILALATTIAVRKGVLKNKKSPSPKHSIAQFILHQSVLDSPQHISSTENEEDFNLILIDDEPHEYEESNVEMWCYVKENILPEEKKILELVLQHNPPKLVGKMKKDYLNLLPKLKKIITEYQKNNN